MADSSKVGLYVRCSTDDQNVDGQLLALHQFCDSQSYAAAPRVEYIEKGVSARKVKPSNRPVFSKVIAACDAGEYSRIITVRIDRLCRNVRDLCDITEKFREMKVDLVFSQQNIDLSGAVGQLFMNILGAIAQFEAELIAQRTIEGLELRKSQGIHIGRPLATGKFSSEDVMTAFVEHCQGLSLRELEKKYKVSRMTLQRRFKEVAEKLDLEKPYKFDENTIELLAPK